MTISIWQILESQAVTDILMRVGYRNVILDLEHGDHTLESIKNAVTVGKSYNAVITARFADARSDLIVRAIDAGIDGVLVSHVSTIEDVIELRNKILSQPRGNRSFSPFVSRYGYGSPDAAAPKDTLLGVLIESEEGIQNIADILRTGYIDFVYFGAYDLSVELGIAGDIFSEIVLERLRKLLSHCRYYKVDVLALFRNREELGILKAAGVTTFVSGVDTGHIFSALKCALDEANSD